MQATAYLWEMRGTRPSAPSPKFKVKLSKLSSAVPPRLALASKVRETGAGASRARAEKRARGAARVGSRGSL